ncbi:MAG TPA: hypothetical protein VMS81_03980 [Methanomicrobiales archaeon]|jgi:hypothetical protein|nr:hypothetical protein [Methanomicrobiales archaeon]
MQQFEKIIRKKGVKKMNWLPVLPLLEEGADPDLKEFMGGVEEDIRAMVGKHYYFIRVGAEGPALCRVPLFTRGKLPREIMDHIQHGISDDDLYHAVGIKEGNHSPQGYYKISDHIEGKLRALFDA